MATSTKKRPTHLITSDQLSKDGVYVGEQALDNFAGSMKLAHNVRIVVFPDDVCLEGGLSAEHLSPCAVHFRGKFTAGENVALSQGIISAEGPIEVKGNVTAEELRTPSSVDVGGNLVLSNDSRDRDAAFKPLRDQTEVGGDLVIASPCQDCYLPTDLIVRGDLVSPGAQLDERFRTPALFLGANTEVGGDLLVSNRQVCTYGSIAVKGAGFVPEIHTFGSQENTPVSFGRGLTVQKKADLVGVALRCEDLMVGERVTADSVCARDITAGGEVLALRGPITGRDLLAPHFKSGSHIEATTISADTIACHRLENGQVLRGTLMERSPKSSGLAPNRKSSDIHQARAARAACLAYAATLRKKLGGIDAN
jgi:hypothetical protein